MIMCAMTMIMNGGFFKDDMVICGSGDRNRTAKEGEVLTCGYFPPPDAGVLVLDNCVVSKAEKDNRFVHLGAFVLARDHVCSPNFRKGRTIVVMC